MELDVHGMVASINMLLIEPLSDFFVLATAAIFASIRCAIAPYALDVGAARSHHGFSGQLICPTGKSLIWLSSPFCKNISVFA